MKNYIKEKLKWIVAGIALFIFTIILVLIIKDNLHPFDFTIFQALRKLENKTTTAILKFFSFIGGTIGVIVITLIFSICIKNKKIVQKTWLNLVLVVFANQTLKNIIDRPRPVWDKLSEASGYSFPSGHTMTAVAFYGLFIYFINQNIKNKKIKILLTIILAIIAIMIGVSRIYLGVHYASDVIAGGMLSIAYLIIFITLTEKKSI